MNKAQALAMIKNFEPGKNGLLVADVGQKDERVHEPNNGEDEHIAWIKPGDAIAFYNYKDDGSAQLDWSSIHCGLPVNDESSKLIANHWFRLNVLADM